MEINDAGARSDDGEVYVSVRVQARADRNAVGSVRDGRLQVRTKVAPADGKANEAVTKLLAEAFGVAPSRIELTRGRTRRDKQFRICGL